MRPRIACVGDGCELTREVHPREYAYLLGQYLGDGCISAGRRGVFRLRITTCDAYPGIREECEAAIAAVLPGTTVGRVRRTGCTELYSYSKHWPCLFPQHGAGPKHLRSIVLRPWQEEIALDGHPAAFVRGLIHSDGCRCINRVTRPVTGSLKSYEYVRYFFVNESADIRGLMLKACRRIGVDVRANTRKSLSIARRASVQRLDEIVGPKH